MNNFTFTNEKTGCEYVRVSKRRACKLFINKFPIIIAACNMRLFTNWGGWSVAQSDTENTAVNFERIVNCYTYYNCNAELGNYPSFYVPKSINERVK